MLAHIVTDMILLMLNQNLIVRKSSDLRTWKFLKIFFLFFSLLDGMIICIASVQSYFLKRKNNKDLCDGNVLNIYKFIKVCFPFFFIKIENHHLFCNKFILTISEKL